MNYPFNPKTESDKQSRWQEVSSLKNSIGHFVQHIGSHDKKEDWWTWEGEVHSPLDGLRFKVLATNVYDVFNGLEGYFKDGQRT